MNQTTEFKNRPSIVPVNDKIKVLTHRNKNRRSKAFGQFWYQVICIANGEVLTHSEMLKNKFDMLNAALNFNCLIVESDYTLPKPKL